MKRISILFIFVAILTCFILTGCASTDDTSEYKEAQLLYGNMEVGDMLFENFEVIKVNTKTTRNLYSYEVVDLNSGVIYLYSYWSNGNGTTCTMTPLYNSDGSVRIYGGK